MANLTKAQRHNRNLDRIFNDYNERQNNLPTINLYIIFLKMAEEKLFISKDEAWNKYGHYTVKEWVTLLKLEQNK